MDPAQNESSIGDDPDRSHITDVVIVTWTITNFEKYFVKNNGVKIESRQFTVYDTSSWYFHLYPKGLKGYEGYLSLFLENYRNVKIPMNVAICMTNNNNAKYVETEGYFEFDGSKKIRGFSRFANRNDYFLGKDTLPDDYELTIRCTITRSQNAILARQQPSVLAELCEFEKMFENGEFYDFTLIVDGKEIKVHKAVLANRSSVFNAMFKHEMKEKNENRVEIKDVGYDVMKELLRYAYAAKVNDIENIVDDLLIAAERYSVDGLKALCEKVLGEKLSIQNVLHYLKYADTNNANTLRSKSLNFIVSNSKAVANSPEFKLFGKLTEELQCEMVRTMFLGDE